MDELQKKDSLLEAFAIPLQEHMILAFTGGGGKTTAMFSLADELAAQGKRVIVTTSTHIFYPTDRVVAELLEISRSAAKELLKKEETNSQSYLGEETILHITVRADSR